MIRRFLALLAAGVTAAAGLAAFQAIAPDPDVAGIEQAAAQAQAGDWNPGNIISDENFYDGNAMSASEVQSFLVSRNGSSSPTALRNYAQATPNMGADRYCQAYQGSGNESAADIIAKVGQACNFSQKAMLVLLEKEQSLLSLQSPTTGRLAAATGFGCPDTAGCDSSVAGFFYQIYYAARQFQVYKANPGSYNHMPFATNNVLYNPNFGCGSSPVFIENYATAGLYNYTPYQPNQAALNNLRGTGDGCSAYGNRNFWWMYTDWFGSTQEGGQSTSPTLITAEGRETFLMAEDGTRHFIPEALVDRYVAAFGKATTVPAQRIDWTPWGSWATAYLGGPDGEAYYLSDEGKLYTFRNCDVAASFGGSCEGNIALSSAQLKTAPAAGTMESFIRTKDGHLLLIQNGTKREVSNLDALARMGFYTATTPDVPNSVVADLPYGTPIVTAGGVIAGEGGEPPIVIDTAHEGHRVPADLAELLGVTTTSTFSSASYAAIAKGDDLSPLMTDGTRSYLATDKGLLEVSAGQYGGGVRFQTVSSAAIAALPQAGTALGAHFVQMQGDSTIQLVAGGERFPLADTAAVEKEAAKRGIDATVYTTLAGVLSGVTEGNGIVNGSVLKPQGSEDLYILDGMYLQPVDSLEIAQALGFTQAPITITTESFDNIQQRTTRLSGTQLTCNGVTGFAAGGSLHPYANAEVQAAYGLSSQTISATLCGLISTGSPASDFVKTDDGTIWWISGGEKRPVGWPQIVTDMGGFDRLVTTTTSVLDQLPTGARLTGVPEGYTAPVETPATPQEPEPTQTPEPTATAQPTEAPDPSATATPTATETAQPTPTATATPTAAPEPPVALEVGDVITDAGHTGLWLVGSNQLLQLGSPQVAAHLGIDVASPIQVPQSNFDLFGSNTAPLYSSAVRCGDTAYVGIDGRLVPFESAEVETAYGLSFVELDAAVCDTLTLSTQKLGAEVQLPNGNTYVVQNGALHLAAPVSHEASPSATSTGEPAATEPAATTPATTEPAGGEPGASETATAEPTTTAPASTEPASTEPAGTEPAATTPAATTSPATLVLPIEVVSAMKRGAPLEG